MTKRQSPTSSQTVVSDVDMAPADHGLKKVKVNHGADYPQDNYTIRSEHLKNSTFDILYMATRARAETPRLLLEYVGANYTSSSPINWPAGKSQITFGVLPVLTHIKPDGSEFEVPETPAMVRYLGRLFDLCGETIEEDAILDAFYSSASDNIFNIMLAEIWMKPNPKDKDCIEKAFKDMTYFFNGFEKYLVKNGSNGYLLGTKTTYPEFALVDWLGHFFEEYPEQTKALVSETVRPACFKLYKRLDSNTRIRAYIDGGRWKYRPAKPLLGLYSTGLVVSDMERSIEFWTKTCELLTVLDSDMSSMENGSEGERYVELKVNSQDKSKVTLYCPGKGQCAMAADQENKPSSISFVVRDTKAIYEQFLKKGVVFKMNPTVTPWGSMAQFVDPDGNAITITEEMKAK